ncbi:GNAT family N-acetyltransferase [Microbacterium sp. No. 7]|uniref:GNAT family N-acetyltransferase n=1 Tax=Microbacterium sp. No. 7 TaxID=1714373 RepID=UPI0006D034DB|nr:GNAT family N-acetyltransferase [Microbacterium sp. No. 7]ALJ19439.1 GCN5 family acetyltransferase [Microbacterium sp. No. 7]
MPISPHALHSAPVRSMDPTVLYGVLRLRVDVFVVEQDCAYPELDGRDLEDAALLVWATTGDAVVATLRILHDGDALRIGRVVVRAEQRGTGVARALFERGLDECAAIDPALPVVLDAQAPLEDWYARFGFRRAGEPFVEDGIPHVPMRREPAGRGA